MMSGPLKLFAYGTLRRGAPMHGLIEERVRWVGPARAPGKLIDLGSFPALIPPRSRRDEVHGDLFEFEPGDAEALLDALDRYEGERFRRESVRVVGRNGEVDAWLYRYVGDARAGRAIHGGDYLGVREGLPKAGGRRFQS